MFVPSDFDYICIVLITQGRSLGVLFFIFLSESIYLNTLVIRVFVYLNNPILF